MSESRYGAAGGLTFVALSVLGGATLPKPPDATASAGTIATYLVHHQHRIELASAAAALAALGLLVLVAYLRERVSANQLAARLLLAGGSVLVTIGLVGALVQGMIAQVSDRLHGDSLLLAFALERATFYIGPAFGVVLLTTAFARGAATAQLPQWLGGLALLVGAVGLVAGVGQTTSTAPAFAAAGFAGFVLTLIWVAATSVTLVREGSARIAQESVR